MSVCAHDLETAWCTICAPHRQHQHTLPPPPPVTATAKFDGHCDGCDLPVYSGQAIVRQHDDTRTWWVHEGCAS